MQHAPISPFLDSYVEKMMGESNLKKGKTRHVPVFIIDVMPINQMARTNSINNQNITIVLWYTDVSVCLSMICDQPNFSLVEILCKISLQNELCTYCDFALEFCFNSSKNDQQSILKTLFLYINRGFQTFQRSS